MTLEIMLRILLGSAFLGAVVGAIRGAWGVKSISRTNCMIKGAIDGFLYTPLLLVLLFIFFQAVYFVIWGTA